MVCSSNRLIIPLTRGWVQAPPLKSVVCFGVCNLMIIQLLNSALERYHSFFNYPIYSLLTKSRYFTLPRRIIVGQLSSSAIESSWLSSSEKSVSKTLAWFYCSFISFLFCFGTDETATFHSLGPHRNLVFGTWNRYPSFLLFFGILTENPFFPFCFWLVL